MQNGIKAISAQVQDGQLEIVFSTGMRSLRPISSLQFAKSIDGVLINLRPSEEELAEVEVWPSGEIVEFPRLDQAF